MSDEQPFVVRLVKGFGHFWWDFLVGDTPELTVAVLVILGVVALVSDVWHVNAVAYILLPLLAVGALSLSVRHAQRGDKPK